MRHRLITIGLLPAGLILLTVAQLVPAAHLGPEWMPDAPMVFGIDLTLDGWDLALMADDWVALVGWTANLWMVVTLLALVFRRTVAAVRIAMVSVVFALIGVLSLYMSTNILEIEIGPWIWLGGFLAIAAYANESLPDRADALGSGFSAR